MSPWRLRRVLRAAQWEHPDARAAFINRQEGAAVDVLAMRSQRVRNNVDGPVGEQVVGTNLDHAWRCASAGGEDRGEVQVVRDHDETVLVCPRKDVGVWRGCFTDS